MWAAVWALSCCGVSVGVAQVAMMDSRVHDRSSDPNMVHGRSSDPNMIHGRSSDSNMVHGRSSDSNMIHGRSSDPNMIHGRSSDPNMIHGRSSDSIMIHGRSSDPNMVHGRSSDSNMIHGRSSDPNVQHGDSGQIHLDPNGLSDLPLGSPDTMETDRPGAPLSPADFETSAGMIHDTVDTSSQADPIELAGLFQGDIMLHDRDALLDLPPGVSRETSRGGRSALIDVHRRWPNGIIPYVISQTYDETERGTIAKAMSEFHDQSCIRFVPRTIEKDYIHILKGDGCSSSVGRVAGAQQVSLGPGCLYVGIVMHELMHAAGFWHEQSRYDRDNHITINKLNVQEGMWHNFEKYTWDKIQSLGIPYDLESVMHYGPYAFAKEGKPTIIPRETGKEIGQRRGFSKWDVAKLQKLYNCANTSTYFVSTSAPLVAAATEECEDNVKHCQMWADMGECDTNPTWMFVSCRKACRQCGKECQDLSIYCRVWSEKGECTNNPEYMTLHCKKSCGLCHDHQDTPVPKQCEDKNKYCSAWSKMRQCDANRDYMHVYCKKSCKHC
ncbi:zinc metalloproteinase nas-13 isoform X3 [Procambarus clarkii]|uniref:zinc metalloproteinase nas-13 isoform X3 n=1 Tax=Procambarus clarkii TaxID=6728 RepID=UPI003743C69F